ncbi:MAG: alpha/beta hydrolase [Bdellovibrionales bacterium]|nr:alpha/beta hydrolase [Bdellovibrionales bacterium]
MANYSSKIRKIAGASKKNRTPLVLLPGGPGLGSHTLEALAELSSDRDLYLVDPPDTGEAGEPKDFDYGATLLDLKAALSALSCPMILVGHSFGGIWAVHLYDTGALDVRGLVCLSVPFSERSFSDLREQYEKYATEEARQREKKFLDNPNENTLGCWTQELGRLYFTEPNIQRGKEMLRSKKFSARLFLGCMSEGAMTASALLPKLKATQIPKILLAGRDDLYTTPASLTLDAEAGGFEFDTIPGGAHFVHFDSPELTCNAIHRFLVAHHL